MINVLLKQIVGPIQPDWQNDDVPVIYRRTAPPPPPTPAPVNGPANPVFIPPNP